LLIRRSSDLKWIKDLPVELVLGDCADKASLKRLSKNGRRLPFWQESQRPSGKRPFLNQCPWTENLIHACLENVPHLQRLIYLSSQAAAGPSRNGNRRKETDPCEPVSPYGRSKRMGRNWPLPTHQLPMVILRPQQSMGQGIKISMSYSNFSQEGSIPAFRTRTSGLASARSGPGPCGLLAADTQPYRVRSFLSPMPGLSLRRNWENLCPGHGDQAFRLCVPKWVLLGMASFFRVRLPGLRKAFSDQQRQSGGNDSKELVCDITKARTSWASNPAFASLRARMTVAGIEIKTGCRKNEVAEWMSSIMFQNL